MVGVDKLNKDRRFAVKKIIFESNEDEDLRILKMNEMINTGRFNHRNIISL